MTQRFGFEVLQKDVRNFVYINRKEAVTCQVYSMAMGSDDRKSAATFCKESGASSVPVKGKATVKKSELTCSYSAHVEKGIRHIIRDC